MKKIKAYRISAILCLLAFAGTSCEKNPGDELNGKGKNFISIYGMTDPDNNFSLVAYDAVKQTRTIAWIERSAVSASVIDATASVDFSLDQTIIDDFNNSNGTHFVLLPATNYTLSGISGNSITFTKGVANIAVDLSVDPQGLDLSLTYAIPIKLSNPSSSYSFASGGDKILVQIIIKNQYDGIYASTGTRYNYNATADYLGWYDPATTPSGTTASVAPWSFDVAMSTRGASTVNCHVGNASSSLGFMNVTVNNDNTVTIESSSDTGVAGLIPLTGSDYVSKYDPATKTFDLYYQWTNAAGTFRVIHDQLVYKGPQ